jgi:hypothetical protein
MNELVVPLDLDRAAILERDVRAELERAAQADITRVAQHLQDIDAAEMKPSNPKDAIGSDKLPLHLWPTTATALGALGLLDGMLKYGRANWRHAGVRASIYYDALARHWNKWFEGEDIDSDSGLPHEAHVLACVAIIVDAKACGMFIDDRQHRGGNYAAFLDSLTPHVKRLKTKHAGKHPKHYTIADNS